MCLFSKPRKKRSSSMKTARIAKAKVSAKKFTVKVCAGKKCATARSARTPKGMKRAIVSALGKLAKKLGV